MTTMNKESKIELFEEYGLKSDYDEAICDRCDIVVGFNADKGRGLFLCSQCWEILDR